MRWSVAVNMQDKDRKRNLNILSVFSDRKILKISKPMWIMYWSNLFLFFFFNLNLGYFLIQFEFYFWQSGFSFHLGLSKSVNFSVWSLPKSPASLPAESFILAGETIGKIICLFFFFKILFYQLLFNRVLLREKNCSSTNFSSTKSSSTKSFQQTSFEQIQSLSLTNSGLPRGILLNIIDPQRTTLPQTFLFNTHLFFSFSLSQI